MNWRQVAVSIAVLAAALFAGPAASAAIIGTTGPINTIAPPASVVRGELESDSTIFLFSERQNFVLSQTFSANITEPGTSPTATSSNLSFKRLAAGTFFNSYYVHFDATNSPGVATVSGSITFDTDVLGIVVRHFYLNETSPLAGLSSVTYGAVEYDSLEFGFGDNPAPSTIDSITLSSDLRTVSFILRSNDASDDFRIVTAVPEPATWALVASALATGLLRYSRSRQRWRR